jgi:hypothetical protein
MLGPTRDNPLLKGGYLSTSTQDERLERFLPVLFCDETEQRTQKGLIDPDLQIKEDPVFQAREWKVQRAGWVLLGLITIAASLGLFGRGLLSSASVADGGLRLRYERWERFQRPTMIQLAISAKPGRTTSVFIERLYLDAIRIESIMPQPEKVDANSRGLIYHFSAEEDPITVTIHLEMEQFGVVSGQIGLVGGPTISLKQFVYP